MKKIFLFALVSSAFAMGLANAETIFVTSTGNNSVIKLTSTGTGSFTDSVFVAPTSDLNGPTGIAVDSNGYVFVSNNNSNEIQEFNPDGSFKQTYATTGIWPRGLAFDSHGNLYVANQASGTVVEYINGSGGTVTQKTILTGLASPNELAFDSSGNLFVTEGTGNQITEITSGGMTSIVPIAGVPLTGPNGLALDSKGNIFVINTASLNLDEIAGGVGSIVGLDNSLIMPKNVAVDAAGDIFITDFHTNTVTEYSSTGQILGSYDANLYQAYGLFIEEDSSDGAVPEPSTYALLLAGVAGLVFWNRRRQQKLAPIRA